MSSCLLTPQQASKSPQSRTGLYRHELIIRQLLLLLPLLGPRVDERTHDASCKANHLQCNYFLCEEHDPCHDKWNGMQIRQDVKRHSRGPLHEGELCKIDA